MRSVLALAGVALSLQACTGAPRPAGESPSEQLLDLKKAIESGAINEQEYDRRVREILHKDGKQPAAGASG
jgi:hypothetical protein